MDDLVKLAGLALFLAAAIVASLLGWTVIQNEAMVWFIVITTQVSIMLSAGSVAGWVIYRCAIALQAMHRRHQEDKRTTAQVMRTIPAPQLTGGQRDSLTAIVAALGGGGIVDAPIDADVVYHDEGD